VRSRRCTIACARFALIRFDESGSQITVHAAIIKSDPLTESNPLNQETLGRAAEAAADDGAPYFWLDALDDKPKQLTLTQVPLPSREPDLI
jgi:hypothetical protein